MTEYEYYANEYTNDEIYARLDDEDKAQAYHMRVWCLQHEDDPDEAYRAYLVWEYARYLRDEDMRKSELAYYLQED